MASHAIRVHFEKYRFSRVANAFARVFRCRTDCLDIVAIDGHRVHSISRSPIADMIDAHGLASMHEGLPLVVFTDKKDRKIPDGSEIQRFMKNAFACSAITEEHCDGAFSSKHGLR